MNDRINIIILLMTLGTFSAALDNILPFYVHDTLGYPVFYTGLVLASYGYLHFSRIPISGACWQTRLKLIGSLTWASSLVVLEMSLLWTPASAASFNVLSRNAGIALGTVTSGLCYTLFLNLGAEPALAAFYSLLVLVEISLVMLVISLKINSYPKTSLLKEFTSIF